MRKAHVSIDKCSGEDCPCHLKSIHTLKNMQIRSISFDHGPPVFPVGGNLNIQMINPPKPPQIDAINIQMIEAYRRIYKKRR